MIVFLYGEDEFRLNEKSKQLREEFFKKNTSNATSSVFDFEENGFSNELRTKIKSRGLFSENILLIIRNFLNQKDIYQKDALVSFFKNNLKDINSSEDLIILEEKNPKKNDKYFKWLATNLKSEEFSKFNETQLRKWISDRFLSLGIKINAEIADKIMISKNSDLFSIDGEILKIVNFIGKNEAPQDLAEKIDALIDSGAEANIFKTIEYISSGNRKLALSTLHKQIEKGDDPFYILSMYIYQFRNLLKIGEFYFNGRADYLEVAKIVKLHPFVVQKGMQQLDNFNYKDLKKIYQKLEKIDQAAKSGKMNVEIGLDLLIAEI